MAQIARTRHYHGCMFVCLHRMRIEIMQTPDARVSEMQGFGIGLSRRLGLLDAFHCHWGRCNHVALYPSKVVPARAATVDQLIDVEFVP